MGTFTDNLLKLTEFPFSYSFIGLLALIFGEGLNFGDEDFFNALGPLLIIMGFVATTLSITDPVGRLQKVYLFFGNLRRELSNRFFALVAYVINRKLREQIRADRRKGSLDVYYVVPVYKNDRIHEFLMYLKSMPTFGQLLCDSVTIANRMKARSIF